MRTLFQIATIKVLIFGVVLVLPQAFAAGAPANLAIAAGNNQSAPGGTRVPGVVCARVTDASNLPVQGIIVTWVVASGGGSITGAAEATDNTGTATLGSWTLGPAAGTNTLTATSPGLNAITFTATATSALPPDNIVLQWNTALLNAFQDSNTAPTVAARALGELHTSIYDAWAAYDPKAVGTQLGGTLRRPLAEQTDANKQIAISYAAYRTLMDLFPAEKPAYDAIMASLNLDPTDMSTDVTTPTGIGNTAAALNITFRQGDGANQLGDKNPGAYTDYTSFTPKNEYNILNDPNKWQPLLMPNGQSQVFTTPQWYLVKTFAIGDPGNKTRTHLYPKPPAVQNVGKTFKTQAQEVLQLSAGLTDLSKTIAAYWVDKAATVTPPGHWNVFAQYVSRRDRHTLDEDVKMFFALGNAELDTSVEIWDVKVQYQSVRPITAIRYLYMGQTIQAWGGPGLGTQAIPAETFQAYIPTPPFAEYISGHSGFSAAGAEILTLFSKSPRFGYSVTLPAGFTPIEPNVPAQPVTFTWEKFTDAANDAGMSRRYGGIHFKDGDLHGRMLGKLIAKLAWKKAQGYFEGKVGN